MSRKPFSSASAGAADQQAGLLDLVSFARTRSPFYQRLYSRYQVIQTAPTTLKVRLELEPGSDVEEVWPRVARYLQDHRAAQGTAPIEIKRAEGPPRRDPVSGNFRKVWTERG